VSEELKVIRAGELSSETTQTPGMFRKTAVDSATGARSLWVGRVRIEPGIESGVHHHGDSESVIFMVSGQARFRFGDGLQSTFEAGPGDYIFVPPNVVHQEINASATEPIDCIVVRDRTENIVVNVDDAGGQASA
jgi:uncharacterized RmlC-like cupin family protein